MWDIESISAANFYNALYGELTQNNLNFQQSISKASLTLIKSQEYSHPYFWGPYFYMGDYPYMVSSSINN